MQRISQTSNWKKAAFFSTAFKFIKFINYYLLVFLFFNELRWKKERLIQNYLQNYVRRYNDLKINNVTQINWIFLDSLSTWHFLHRTNLRRLNKRDSSFTAQYSSSCTSFGLRSPLSLHGERGAKRRKEVFYRSMPVFWGQGAAPALRLPTTETKLRWRRPRLRRTRLSVLRLSIRFRPKEIMINF